MCEVTPPFFTHHDMCRMLNPELIDVIIHPTIQSVLEIICDAIYLLSYLIAPNFLYFIEYFGSNFSPIINI